MFEYDSGDLYPYTPHPYLDLFGLRIILGVQKLKSHNLALPFESNKILFNLISRCIICLLCKNRIAQSI